MPVWSKSVVTNGSLLDAQRLLKLRGALHGGCALLGKGMPGGAESQVLKIYLVDAVGPGAGHVRHDNLTSLKREHHVTCCRVGANVG